MKILGLDISTKTGFAVLSGGDLKDYGLMTSPAVSDSTQDSNFSILRRAQVMADKIRAKISEVDPDIIIIEQTNQGSFRTDQKQLEFIHGLTLLSIADTKYAKNTSYVDTSRWRSVLNIRLTKEQRKHNKAVKSKLARGKVTPKHLAVAWANQIFSLELLKKDHDIADAICLASYGHNHSLRTASTVPVSIDLSVLNPPTAKTVV